MIVIMNLKTKYEVENKEMIKKSEMKKLKKSKMMRSI
jgi:hypothetical protein